MSKWYNSWEERQEWGRQAELWKAEFTRLVLAGEAASAETRIAYVRRAHCLFSAASPAVSTRDIEACRAEADAEWKERVEAEARRSQPYCICCGGRPPDCYCPHPIFRVMGVTYLIEAREIRGLEETRAMRGW